MKQGSLSEQMGAMALVDQLRLQHRQVQDHLDLPRRREEVAERIRTYYQAQGIVCDDALIAQGVRAFFAERLVFKAPGLSRRCRSLCWLIMHQGRIAVLLFRAALLIGTFALVVKLEAVTR
ncbi:DUF6384 family protein [Pseudomonas sp. CC120222-01a]|uniref:DUF6384 family protein n=1 Tax=Pseudomonas sp. CC120222-01a TaxID=1378075 RepID=UPI000D83FB31|nr:DUF6384 family protein [Pseudomonas sp. CC120222-01a]PVZ40690.1 hypothetical protein N430_02640 [Pseudomonas sp. CC120222-01a]